MRERAAALRVVVFIDRGDVASITQPAPGGDDDTRIG
jgi:hypothetical protein